MPNKDLEDRMDAAESALLSLMDKVTTLESHTGLASATDAPDTALADRVTALETEVFPPKAAAVTAPTGASTDAAGTPAAATASDGIVSAA